MTLDRCHFDPSGDIMTLVTGITLTLPQRTINTLDLARLMHEPRHKKHWQLCH